MARRGRPPKGTGLVDGLQASDDAREKLRIILQTVTGELSVEEGCRQLGVAETRFHDLRNEVLHSAAQALEPRRRGRPPTPEPTEEAREVDRLRQQVVDLSIDLRAAQIREEIALISPHLLKPPKADEKNAKKKRSRSPPGSPGATNSTPSGSAPSSETST